MDVSSPKGGSNSTSPKKRSHKDVSDSTSKPAAFKEYKRMNAFGEHKRAVSSVKLAPSRICRNRPGAALAASASADGTCKIWDLTNCANGLRRVMQPVHTCVGHSRGINEVSWNPVAPLVATASDDKTVRLWDAVTNDCAVELRGHDNFVFCVDQHHSTVVTGSFDETVKLWDIRTGGELFLHCFAMLLSIAVVWLLAYGLLLFRCAHHLIFNVSIHLYFCFFIIDCVSTLPAHSDPVTAVSFNRDGTTVSSASHDGLIRIWDVATGECLKTIYAAGNPPVSSVKYAPNSKYLLAGTLDSTLRLWPVTVSGTNCCARQYRDKHFVNSKYSVVADFTAAGDIVVGSETGDVVLFDLQTAEVKQVLRGHEDAVLAVAAHDKMPLLATGAMTTDRRVEFWSQDFDPSTRKKSASGKKRAHKKQE